MGEYLDLLTKPADPQIVKKLREIRLGIVLSGLAFAVCLFAGYFSILANENPQDGVIGVVVRGLTFVVSIGVGFFAAIMLIATSYLWYKMLIKHR